MCDKPKNERLKIETSLQYIANQQQNKLNTHVCTYVGFKLEIIKAITKTNTNFNVSLNTCN